MEVVYDRAIAGDTGAQCVILLAVGGNFSVENNFKLLHFLKLFSLFEIKRVTGTRYMVTFCQ